jgi:colanic acid/amylovoran biosynthesis glycosyltransferase
MEPQDIEDLAQVERGPELNAKLKVAYIMSMVGSGMTAWNFREIDILTNHGVQLFGYPTKWSDGPYMPKAHWPFRRPSMLRSLLAQPKAMLRFPRRYFTELGVALKMKTLPEFLMGADYACEMETNGIQHIHCHFGDRKLFLGYFASRFTGLPLTVTVHAYEILMNPNPAMFRMAAAACETVVTVSEFNKKELVSRFGVNEETIQVIHIHGDVSADQRADSIKLLIVAEYREKKGHDILFGALKKLSRDDLVLWVAGDGQEDIPSLAREMGVGEQVVFMGRLKYEPLSVLFDSCDIFVLPSRTAKNGDREGIPVALMEAMSRKKPVISTYHVGIPELVRNGLLVEENDVDGLADAIEKLADDHALRVELGQKNQSLIQDEFSEPSVLELMDLFGKRREQEQ